MLMIIILTMYVMTMFNAYWDLQISEIILQIKHAHVKKKYLRANDSPFLTKHLRQIIMNRSRSKNIFLKIKTVANWERYIKLRNECVKLTKKAKSEYFKNINLNILNDNKTFWKTIKPIFFDKNKTHKILLVENGEIISDNKKTTEIFNDHFTNIVKKLNIPDINFKNQFVNPSIISTDPIDSIIQTYDKHPSILKIRGYIDQTKIFSFHKVNITQMEMEINQLNPKKAPGVDGIPANILKGASDILKSPFTELYNISMENQQFPDNLKFANVTPLFKKDDNTDKANYRPLSVLPSTSKLFERLMFKQITTFVVNKISQYLCRFRKGYKIQDSRFRYFI